MYLIYIGKRCSGVSVQDVVFVIDASGSIGRSHFQLIREFTTNITTALISNSPRSAVGVFCLVILLTLNLIFKFIPA